MVDSFNCHLGGVVCRDDDRCIRSIKTDLTQHFQQFDDEHPRSTARQSVPAIWKRHGVATFEFRDLKISPNNEFH